MFCFIMYIFLIENQVLFWERPTKAEGSGELVGEIKQDKRQEGGEEPGKTY